MASYVIGGLSRLSVRVSKLLVDEGDDVAVLATPEEQDVAHLLDPRVKVVPFGADREAAMRQAGLEGAACLLALGSDDLENLRTLVAASAASPDVPLVLRAFDPTLAEQVTRHGHLRRAYSVSALAAPAFVVAAYGGAVDETMRLGSGEVPIARLQLAAGSPLAGLTISGAEARYGCAVIAEAPRDGTWRPVIDRGRVLAEGESIAAGGVLMDLLRLARDSASVPPAHTRRRPSAAARRSGRAERRRRIPGPLLVSLGLLLAVLVAMVAAFGVVLHVGPIHAFYDAVNTAFGSPPIDASRDVHAGLKIFAVISMIGSGILVGAVFSFATAAVTEDRLERREIRRIAHFRGHAIVAGLDNVGFRIEEVLHRLSIPVVAVDPAPDPRFSAALTARTPLVVGDPRIRENLERAGIGEAAVLYAVTGDELLNVEVCLQAKAQHHGIRTVARVFDEDFAEDASRTLGIDATLSTSTAAATAFVSAATDEQAVRPFLVGELRMAARRLDSSRVVPREEIQGWAAQGVQALAYRTHRDGVRPASSLPDVLEPGAHVIVAGPEEAVRALG